MAPWNRAASRIETPRTAASTTIVPIISRRASCADSSFTRAVSWRSSATVAAIRRSSSASRRFSICALKSAMASSRRPCWLSSSNRSADRSISWNSTRIRSSRSSSTRSSACSAASPSEAISRRLVSSALWNQVAMRSRASSKSTCSDARPAAALQPAPSSGWRALVAGSPRRVAGPTSGRARRLAVMAWVATRATPAMTTTASPTTI